MKEIARGAEAVLYEDGETVVKHRLKKSYRLQELDHELRKQRTRREANLLKKLTIPHPKLIDTDKKEKIIMEKIEGEKVRDVLDNKPVLAKRIGEILAEMHNQHFVHGDLTTSNMILDFSNEIIFIDFGLSFQTHKIEDKAADIHLFKQALESKHHKVFDKALKEFFKGYKKADEYDKIIERLAAVEKRGRHKKK